MSINDKNSTTYTFDFSSHDNNDAEIYDQNSIVYILEKGQEDMVK